MAAPDLDITIDQGEDWIRIYQYFDEVGQWILMGEPGWFAMVDDEGMVNFQISTLTYEPGSALSGYLGGSSPEPGQQVRVTLPREVTKTMPVGKWRYGIAASYRDEAKTISLVRGWATVRSLAWTGC